MKYLAALLLFFSGCSGISAPQSHLRTPLAPDAEVLAWSGNLVPETEGWADEAEKRFGVRPIVFFAHGATDHGVWTCYPDYPRSPTPVSSVAWMLRDLYPGRMIVMIVCNEGHARLDVPGVIYARRSVWNRPGPDQRINKLDGKNTNAVGDISEFEVGQLPDSIKTVLRDP